ncbi:hypothetical protein M9435_003329 [Picochlorum sp. BPE23]|nr:hypothetical protein M9435_003329 [Picochlorum sp. BPE23]
MKTRGKGQEHLSTAERALQEKFKIIKHRRALQIDRERRAQERRDADRLANPLDTIQDADAARQEAIRIIRARRLAATHHGGVSKPDGQGALKIKTKIKLTVGGQQQSTEGSKAKAASVQRETVSHAGEEKKKVERKKPHIVKRKHHAPSQEQQQEQEQQPPLPPTPTLFISNLPDYYTSDNIYEYFTMEYNLPVTDVRIYEGHCSGLVTFPSFQDAQALLDFQQSQPLVLEDRNIIVSWANAEDLQQHYELPVDPRARNHRAAHVEERAQRVASQMRQHDIHQPEMGDDADDEAPSGRHVVSYDDL